MEVKNKTNTKEFNDEITKKIKKMEWNIQVLEIEKKEIIKYFLQEKESLSKINNNLLDELKIANDEIKELQLKISNILKEKEAVEQQLNDIVKSKNYKLAKKILSFVNKVIS